jgi:iron(II)-dependent oxidoreductase
MPVVNVSAVDAQSFCSFIGRRLPIASEWLWAATSGTDRAYPWGNKPPTPTHANLRPKDATEPEPTEPKPTGPDEMEPRPVPVDSSDFTAGRTPEGVEHLLGNVQEWVATEGKYDDEGNAHLIGNWDLRDGAVPVALMGGSYVNYPAILTDLVLIAEASFADDVSGFRCITDNE